MKSIIITAFAASLAVATPALAQNTTVAGNTVTKQQIYVPQAAPRYSGDFRRGIDGVNRFATQKLRQIRSSEPHRGAD